MGWLARLLGTSGGTEIATPSADAATALAPGTVLIDVRSDGEFNAGHIEGAVSVPLDRIQFEIARVAPDPTVPLLLYCQSGGRSGSACRIVAAMGYESVRNGGGIGSLSRALGRPVTARGR